MAAEDIETVRWVAMNDQLRSIAMQVREIASDMAKWNSQRENMLYRLDQLEQRPKNDRDRYTLYTLFGGCAYMLVQTAITVAIAVVTIYLSHH